MLTKSVTETTRDRLGFTAVAGAFAATHLTAAAAANSPRFARNEVRARRQRRQERAERRNLGGWTVRMW